MECFQASEVACKDITPGYQDRHEGLVLASRLAELNEGDGSLPSCSEDLELSSNSEYSLIFEMLRESNLSYGSGGHQTIVNGVSIMVVTLLALL